MDENFSSTSSHGSSSRQLPDTDPSHIFWSKMKGYPWWPSRYCAIFEAYDLVQKLKPEQGCMPVMFFQKTYQKAWVHKSKIKPFDVDSMMPDGYFSPFNFRKDESYRLGFVEAVRLWRKQGNELPKSIRSFLNEHYRTWEIPPSKIRKEDAHPICSVCTGTARSGFLLRCAGNCGKASIHSHCLLPNRRREIFGSGRWVCNTCCRSNGWRPGVILPADESLRPFFGVVDNVKPPTGSGRNDQLYHVTFEDGDMEEYYESELLEHKKLYQDLTGKSPHCDARKRGQAAEIGTKIAKYFQDESISISPKQQQHALIRQAYDAARSGNKRKRDAASDVETESSDDTDSSDNDWVPQVAKGRKEAKKSPIRLDGAKISSPVSEDKANSISSNAPVLTIGDASNITARPETSGDIIAAVEQRSSAVPSRDSLVSLNAHCIKNKRNIVFTDSVGSTDLDEIIENQSAPTVLRTNHLEKVRTKQRLEEYSTKAQRNNQEMQRHVIFGGDMLQRADVSEEFEKKISNSPRDEGIRHTRTESSDNADLTSSFGTSERTSVNVPSYTLTSVEDSSQSSDNQPHNSIASTDILRQVTRGPAPQPARAVSRMKVLNHETGIRTSVYFSTEDSAGATGENRYSGSKTNSAALGEASAIRKFSGRSQTVPEAHSKDASTNSSVRKEESELTCMNPANAAVYQYVLQQHSCLMRACESAELLQRRFTVADCAISPSSVHSVIDGIIEDLQRNKQAYEQVQAASHSA